MAALAFGLAGCSATTEVNAPASTGGTTAKSTTTTTPVAHVGATLPLNGASGAAADVTLTQVIDPATPASQVITPDAGKRYVATLIKIEDTGTSSIQGDANNDSSLIGSDGQTYTPDFGAVSECTNFNGGNYQLGVGESAVGCVIYQVPTSVIPAKYQFSPNSGFSGTFGEWIIP